MTADRSRRVRVARAAQRAVVAAMALVVVLAALFALSVNSVFGTDWRRQVVSVARRVEPVSRLLARPGAGPTPPPVGRAPRPTPVPSLITGTPQATGAGGVNPSALTDGQTTQRAAAWRTREGQTTAELRFAAAGAARRAVFAHSETFPRETWAKDVEVWLVPAADGAAASGPQAEVRAGVWTLAQTIGEQSFPIPPTAVQGVRLLILTNYGSREYTSLA
ncbi:MAG TPA: hypothetical protein VFX49_17555, partial [Chloroflexota bacterium]|nr:hypothetical protein [Chloroflexota bacterium]